MEKLHGSGNIERNLVIPTMSPDAQGMYTPRFILILVLAILSSLGTAYAAEKINGFAQLAPGDTLQIRFTSRGCFHSYSYDLTFTRTPEPSVSVAAVRLALEGPEPRPKYRDAERRERGHLPLSESDFAGLDTLLGFYRTNSLAGCTTHDEIKISEIRDGKVIATEKFKDASCRAHDVKGVLLIDALVQRLSKKKNNE